MAEDILKRYHIADKAALIRGSSEAGFKKGWEDIFHTEELSEREAVLHGPRIPGGGEGALDMLFQNPDNVDPELKVLFSDYLEDVYGVDDYGDLLIAVLNEKNRLEQQYRRLLKKRGASPDALEQITQVLDRVRHSEYMASEGLETQVRENFVKWLNSEDNEGNEYNLEGTPQEIIEKLERRRQRGEKVSLTADITKIESPRIKDDMQFWLNAWKDPEAGLEAIGLKFDDGKVLGVALKSKRYGTVGVPFVPWSLALGGEKYENRKNGTTVYGVDFGKGHIIAPGEGEKNIKETIKTLEISGVSHPNLQVVFLRK